VADPDELGVSSAQHNGEPECKRSDVYAQIELSSDRRLRRLFVENRLAEHQPKAPPSSILLVEQVGVRSGCCEQKVFADNLINQQPIWGDVAFAVTAPCPFEQVRSREGRERLVLPQ
jgi:hypothetical protein